MVPGLLLGAHGRAVRARRGEHLLDGRRRRADHDREGRALATGRGLVDDPDPARSRRRGSCRPGLGPRLRGSRRRHGHVRDVASAGQVTVVVAVPYTRWMKRLLLPGIALVLVLTACGGSHKSATATHSSLTVLPFSLSVPQVAAQPPPPAR